MPVCGQTVVATNANVKIDNAAGSPVDVSGETATFEIALENTIAEFRGFGTQWKCRKVVGKDGPISIAGVVTGNDAQAYGLLRGWFFDGDDSARTVTLSTPDTNAGSDEYSAECVLASFTFPHDAEADDFVRWSAELMPNGAVTHTEIAS